MMLRRPNVMPFSHIHFELILPILSKMHGKALCRLRQTCKSIDNFVWNNRRRISCRSEKEWLLEINVIVNDDEQPHLKTMIFEALEHGPTHEFSSYTREEFNHAGRVIDDPVKQLSGLAFDIVNLENSCRFGETYYKIGALLCKNKLCPILEELKLNCDRFRIYIPFFPACTFFKLIKFRHLSVNCPRSFFTEYSYSLIENCQTISVEHSRDLPENLADFSHNFTNVHIDSYEDEMLEMFVEYLKELMLNGSARGKLEHLVLGMDNIYDYHNLPEYFPTMKTLLQCLDFDAVNEPIIDRNDLLRFNILEIDGGFAVIVMKTSTCEVQFLPKADRQSLYEVFVRELFWRIPVDPSAYYDAFMAAESEEIAFSELAEEAFAVYFSFAREIDIEASNFWSDDSDVSDMEYDADEENVSSEEDLDSDDDL